MDRQKIVLTGIVAIVFAVFLASSALAHQKYRTHHKGMPRRIQVQHLHSPSESAEFASTTQSKVKGFGLLAGAAGIVTGTSKMLGNAVNAVFCGKAEPVSEIQKIESRKDSFQHRNNSFSRKHKHPRGMPR